MKLTKNVSAFDEIKRKAMSFLVKDNEELVEENERLRSALEEIALREYSSAPAEVMAIKALKPQQEE